MTRRRNTMILADLRLSISSLASASPVSVPSASQSSQSPSVQSSPTVSSLESATEIAADVSRLLRKDKGFATRLQDWQHIQRVLSNGRGLDRGTRRNKPGLGMVGENNAACIALCAADGLQQRQGGKKLLSGQIRLTRVGTFTPSKRTTRTRTMARATPATGGPT